MSTEKLSKPVAWTDAEELRDLEKGGCGAMLSLEKCKGGDPRRQILLFTHPAPETELKAVVERLNASGYEYENGPVTTRNASAVVDILLQQLDDAVQENSVPFFDDSKNPKPIYSQEYVSALLAELEAKDQAHRVHAARLISERGVLREQVKELKEQKKGWVDIAKAVGLKHGMLKAKLATPVRLPTAMFCPEEYVGSLLWSETEAHNKAISKCAEALRAAGFKVEGDAQ